MMPVILSQDVSFTAAQLPVAIDYPAALALRQMAVAEIPACAGIECPAPLLATPSPQDAAGTLWNTGARIN